MLIECPSCHTRFAVESQQLSYKKSAHFHCSRCDHYFEAKPQETKIEEPEVEEVKKKSKSIQMSLLEEDEEISDKPAKKKRTRSKEEKKSWTIEKKEEAFQISFDLEKKGPERFKDKTAFALICSVPLLSLALIATLSWQVKNLPEFAKDSLGLGSYGLHQIPPQGLELANLKLEPSQKGLTIKGEVMNTSLKSFSELRVKTAFYTEGNTKLKEILSKHSVELATNSKSSLKIQIGEVPKKSTLLSSSLYSAIEVPL